MIYFYKDNSQTRICDWYEKEKYKRGMELGKCERKF